MDSVSAKSSRERRIFFSLSLLLAADPARGKSNNTKVRKRKSATAFIKKAAVQKAGWIQRWNWNICFPAPTARLKTGERSFILFKPARSRLAKNFNQVRHGLFSRPGGINFFHPLLQTIWNIHANLGNGAKKIAWWKKILTTGLTSGVINCYSQRAADLLLWLEYKEISRAPASPSLRRERQALVIPRASHLNKFPANHLRAQWNLTKYLTRAPNDQKQRRMCSFAQGPLFMWRCVARLSNALGAKVELIWMCLERFINM